MDKKLPRVPKDTKTGLPKKYVPKGLSKADKAKQVSSIKKGTDRPKLKSAPPAKRSMALKLLMMLLLAKIY
jgi:hypothetical protein